METVQLALKTLDATASASASTGLAKAKPVVVPAADRAMFEHALNQHRQALGAAANPNNDSFSSQIAQRVRSLSAEVKNDHARVSHMVEQAAHSGNQSDMVKAMIGLSEYQLKVQFVSKVVSKAATSVDQLTRMQ